MDRKLLGIYLQDHYAGATGGLALADRAAGANEDSEFGPFLRGLRDEIAQERERLREIMESLDIGADRVKIAGAWAAEKAGRLKLNGSLRGSSPLSRMVELEALTIGVRGKLSMYEILREVAETEPKLKKAELTRLTKKAEKQLVDLKEQRLKAARLAFS